MQRESFVFYQSFRNATKHLPKENQKNALVMIVEYGIDGIEPDPEIDGVAYAMFLMAKPQIDKNNQRFLNGNKGGRPKKNWENSQKPKPNQTISKTKPNNIQTQTEHKPNVNVNDNVNVNENNNLLLYNNLNILSNDNTETKVSEFSKKEISIKIDNLIKIIKDTCNELGVAYNSKNERNFGKHIISGKEFGEFCEKIGQTREEFAKNILLASVKIKYWKGPCASLQMIYQNYTDVYNKTLIISQKQKEREIKEF